MTHCHLLGCEHKKHVLAELFKLEMTNRKYIDAKALKIASFCVIKFMGVVSDLL